jgi:hypothetical protein
MDADIEGAYGVWTTVAVGLDWTQSRHPACLWCRFSSLGGDIGAGLALRASMDWTVMASADLSGLG